VRELLPYLGLPTLIALVALLGWLPRMLRTSVPVRARDVLPEPRNSKITPAERALIEEVFARVVEGADRQLREVLMPRTEVAFLDAALPLAAAAEVAVRSPHSRFPVYRESHDEVIGFVHVRDLLHPAHAGRLVGDLVRPVKYLPASTRVLSVLSEMRHEGHHLAIVIDEYGGTAGIVTLEDLVEELIGDIRDEYDVHDARPRRLHGGVLEVDGLLNLDAFAAQTGITLPAGPYETVAGHIMAALGRIPAPGDVVEVAGHRLAVAGMDGRRVARVRVTPDPLPDAQPENAPESKPEPSPRGDASAGA
jgi:magnesium and cobalt exporter, CNNM family